MKLYSTCIYKETAGNQGVKVMRIFNSSVLKILFVLILTIVFCQNSWIFPFEHFDAGRSMAGNKMIIITT